MKRKIHPWPFNAIISCVFSLILPISSSSCCEDAVLRSVNFSWIVVGKLTIINENWEYSSKAKENLLLFSIPSSSFTCTFTYIMMNKAAGIFMKPKESTSFGKSFECMNHMRSIEFCLTFRSILFQVKCSIFL